MCPCVAGGAGRGVLVRYTIWNKAVHTTHFRYLLTSGGREMTVFDIEQSGTPTDIGAYCLMPNHFHILVYEKEEKGVSMFMQKLMTAYTMYFNKKYDRTGALFGLSFKAKHVTDDNHLKFLFPYIHLNPLEAVGDRKNLQRYAYSSYPDYLGTDRKEKSILETKSFPDYFQGALEEEISFRLSSSPDISPEV